MNIHVLDVTSINLTSVRYCFFKDFAHSFVRIDLLKIKVDLGYNFLVMQKIYSCLIFKFFKNILLIRVILACSFFGAKVSLTFTSILFILIFPYQNK